MSISSVIQDFPEAGGSYEVVQPSVPDTALQAVTSCGCLDASGCQLHCFVCEEEVAPEGIDRLNANGIQRNGEKILCYRANAGLIPELRDAYLSVNEVRAGIQERVRQVTEDGVLFRGNEHGSIVLERFSDPVGNFPPAFNTGSQVVVTAHEYHGDKYGHYPHDYDPFSPPAYFKVAVAPKVVVARKPDVNLLKQLDSEPLPFKSVPTDVQTLASFDPVSKHWKSVVLPAGELGTDHWERMFHYPDGFITGMVFYRGEDGIYGFRIDQHIRRACRDAKRRGFEGVSETFLKKLFSEQLSADRRWIPSIGNRPGNRYYGRFVGYPTNAAPPLRGKEKEMLFLGTPVGPYRNVQMLKIRQMGPRPVVKGFGDVKHVTNYAGPVEMFAPFQDEGYHEAMFMEEEREGQKRVQEGTSVNYAFVYHFLNNKPTIKIPSLRHGDILPGITMHSVAELAASYGYDVIFDEDISEIDLKNADEILVTGTAMTVRGVGRIDSVQGEPLFVTKLGENMGPVANRLAVDFQKILKREHEDPRFNDWMQKVADFD